MTRTIAIADNIHIGDEIEAYVMRVNDQEGTIMLSKKRLGRCEELGSAREGRGERRSVSTAPSPM